MKEIRLLTYDQAWYHPETEKDSNREIGNMAGGKNVRKRDEMREVSRAKFRFFQSGARDGL